MDTETDTAKYLGVSLHRHSSWSPHINATAKKANGTRAFLQRNLRNVPTAVKTRTYESLICPILEYSGVVWDPHNAQDVNKLEMVQHRYARYTSRDYGRTSSVTAILKTLGWEPLAERRAKARITMMYIIVHGLVDILASDHIIQAPASRRNGNAQFRVPYARTLAYQRGIFPDGTRLWNAIPNEVTKAESIDTFMERLSRPMLRSLQHPVNSHFCTYMHLFPGVVDTFSHTHTVRDTLVGSCTIYRPWLKPNKYYRGGDYI